MSSHVYYRFSSSKDFDFVRFDGEFIRVGELKCLISKKTGVWKDRTTVIELFDPRTGEEYKQNNTMIRKNGSVMAKRSPAVRATPINLPPKESALAPPKKPDPKPAVDQKKDEDDEDLFGPDAFAPAPEEEEDAAMKQLTKGLHESWQVEMNSRGGQGGGWGRGRGSGPGMRGRGGRNRGGRGLGFPPYGYVCHRCNIPGHYIEDCPTNGDPAFDFKRVRYPTGIPSSMLEKDDQGGLLMPNGERARLKPNRKKFEQEMAGVPKPDRYKNLEGGGDQGQDGKDDGQTENGNDAQDGVENRITEGGQSQGVKDGPRDGGASDRKGDSAGIGAGENENGGEKSGGVSRAVGENPKGVSPKGTGSWNSLMNLPSFVDPFGVVFPVVKNDLPDASVSQLRKAFFEGKPIPEEEFRKFQTDHEDETRAREASTVKMESMGTSDQPRSPIGPPMRDAEMHRHSQGRMRSPEGYRMRGPPPGPRGPQMDYRFHGDFAPGRPPAGPYRNWGPDVREWHHGPFREPEWYGEYRDRRFGMERFRPMPPYMDGPGFPPRFRRDMYGEPPPPRMMDEFHPGFRREWRPEMDEMRWRTGGRGEPLYPDRYDQYDRFYDGPMHPRHGPPRHSGPPSISGGHRYSNPQGRSPEEVRSGPVGRFDDRSDSPAPVSQHGEPGGDGTDMRSARSGGDPKPLTGNSKDDRPDDQQMSGNKGPIGHEGGESGRHRSEELGGQSSARSGDGAGEKSGRMSKRVDGRGPEASGDGSARYRDRSQYGDRGPRDDRPRWSAPDLPEFAQRRYAMRGGGMERGHGFEPRGPGPNIPGFGGPSYAPPRPPPPPPRDGLDRRVEHRDWDYNEDSRARHHHDREFNQHFIEECKRQQKDLRDVLQEEDPRFRNMPGPRRSHPLDGRKPGGEYRDEYGESEEGGGDHAGSRRSRHRKDKYREGHERSHWKPGQNDRSDDRQSDWGLEGSQRSNREGSAQEAFQAGAMSPHRSMDVQEEDNKGTNSTGDRWQLDDEPDVDEFPDEDLDMMETDVHSSKKHRSDGHKKRKSGKKRHRDEHKSKSKKSEKSKRHKKSKEASESKEKRVGRAKREVYID